MADKIIDYVSGLEISASPEEVASTQVFSRILVEDYGYPKEMLQTRPQYRVKSSPSDPNSYPVDIAVFEEKDGVKHLKMIVENKRPTRTDGRAQLEIYLKFSEARIGVWFNGSESLYLKKSERSGNITFEEIPAIPKYGEKLEEIGRYRRRDLKKTHNLKNIFSEIRGYIVGNSVGVNRDESIAKEMINLILCKIYDERFTPKDKMVSFRVSDCDDNSEVEERINKLFSKVKAKYDDVLEQNDAISLDGNTLRHIIGKLQNFCLIETDRDIIADAFEVFIGYSLKGEQGQFFTPKNVVRLMVNAVDPGLNDVIIDPSCGSGGFLVESLKYLWAKVDSEAEELEWEDAAVFEEKKEIGIKNIRGIEKDAFLTKVAKSYMAILGDGKGGIFCEDSLDDPKNWKEKTRQLIRLDSMDVCLANPPFGKDIKITGKEKLSQYELAKNSNGKLMTEGNPSTLFFERDLQLLKDGGILGIILPETYFHAPSKRAFRDFFKKHNIKWIIDLPHNTFRPHNNAKCIVIIVQKNMPQQKYINMAVAEYIGHDHTGRAIYVKDAGGNTTDRVQDDIPAIIDEIIEKRNNTFRKKEGCKEYTFEVEASDVIKKDIFVPRYYWKSKLAEIERLAEEEHIRLIPLKQLLDEKVIATFDGNGSPGGEFKGQGEVPYIRVKDIVQWQIYKDPTALIPESEYKRLYKPEKQLKEKDILYVSRGSYRIGSVAMVSPYDLKCILTREIKVIRLLKEDNKYGLTAEYLLYALSHQLVAEQSRNKIFIDTTLPNIAKRWTEIRIPVFEDVHKYEQVKELAKKIVEQQWNALKEIDHLKKNYDVYYT